MFQCLLYVQHLGHDIFFSILSYFPTSLVTYYEILSGLKHRDALKKIQKFLIFSELNNIISLNKKSREISADIYAESRKKGTLVDDIDLLIAGVAIANDLVLVTHNQKHFGKIEYLELEDWTW